ncbi:MAG: hypothetical protein V4681_01120 [Patescibacteria group bacterium]
MRVPLPELLLRVAVAFSFAYPPVAALIDPDSWLGYFPAFMPSSIVLLHIFGAFEILIALWILFGRRIWIPSGIAAVVLLAIVAFNVNQFDILFRDISIAFAAAALSALHYRKRSREVTYK